MSKLNGIAGEIKRIKDAVEIGDFEVAHSIEDALYASFLYWIVEPTSCITPEVVIDMARKILASKEIEFPRWTS